MQAEVEVASAIESVVPLPVLGVKVGIAAVGVEGIVSPFHAP